MDIAKYDPSILTCPLCGGRLEYQPLGGSCNTSCSKCDYQEPKGSAEFIFFLTETLSLYARHKNLNEMEFTGQNGETSILPIKKALRHNAGLPLFIKQASDFQYDNPTLRDLIEREFNLAFVRDDKSFFSSRCVWSDTGDDEDTAKYKLSKLLILLTLSIDNLHGITALAENIPADQVRRLQLKHYYKYSPFGTPVGETRGNSAKQTSTETNSQPSPEI